MTKLPAAPFSERLSSNEVVIIFMGYNAQNRALGLRSHFPTTTLYLPERTSPMRYLWPLEGSYIYLCDTGWSSMSFVKFCAMTFLSYGAVVVEYISTSNVCKFEKGVSL